MLIISPFMLTVYAGVALAYRSQYTLPFVIAVGFVYLTRRRDDEAVEKKKSINKIVRKTIQALFNGALRSPINAILLFCRS